jgi:hypothetical protein
MGSRSLGQMLRPVLRLHFTVVYPVGRMFSSFLDLARERCLRVAGRLLLGLIHRRGRATSVPITPQS